MVYYDGDISVGSQLPDDVMIYPIEGDPQYGYVYINDRPALVDANSRTVIWVR